jgi:hypothetical protein
MLHHRISKVVEDTGKHAEKCDKKRGNWKVVVNQS